MDQTEVQLAVWRLFLERYRVEAALADALTRDDSEAVAAAETTLTALPAVSPLDALRANAELISRLSAQRWIAMKAARDQGSNLEQIGTELGVSRQAAWEFLQRKIADHAGGVGTVIEPDVAGQDARRWKHLGEKLEEYRSRVTDELWQQFVDQHHEGDTIQGIVTKVVPFGSIVEVSGPISGLVSRSMAAEFPDVGTAVEARIVTIDHENRRVSLAPVTDG